MDLPRRIQFVECPNNMNGMIDAAKYADAAILITDANYGYKNDEIRKLANFLSVMEFHTSSWRAAHPYLLVDHFEYVTSPANVHMDGKCKRDIYLYGYLRGCDIKKGTKMQAKEPQSAIESFRIGTYLRFRVLGVPFETVANHDPCQPILVGGISREEDNVGHMQVRLTRHSWHMNRRKTKDPIIVSVGWRRYQTTPIYYQDSNGRHEMLEYAPEDQPCLATFWGPVAPSGAGVVAVRSLADNKAPFRILATAELLDLNHTAKIVKEIKRIGTPCLIWGETALIKDMFTSDDEVDRYRDVKIKTACGIQGEVNEAAKPYLLNLVKWNDGQPREGIAKCTFDRRICMNDTILMHEWTKVEVPCIFNPLTTALEPSNRVWQCMDSVDKRQKKLNESEESESHVLVVGEENIATGDLRKRLMDIFDVKLKDGPAQKRQTDEQRRAVIFVRPMAFDSRFEMRDDWMTRRIKRICERMGPGMITTIMPGLRLDKEARYITQH
ncbi:hypothetical protein C5167_044443 [Papaver somniferum]|uniref:Ribosome biogenesis protein BMS1/TSR1 C-terminal domain-containing protein n=1 Tax=Papaver somniferum TaxID=3469 RepID=A0A4Y7L9C4_PAPSO|nr:hypothetical protein C5167_044443 [Papaver somniferum]